MCLARGALDPDGFPSKYQDVPYDGRPEGLEVHTYVRSIHAEWFEWVDAVCPASTDRADHVYMVRVELEDAADLGYLQAAWGTVRWYVDAGAYIALDMASHRWHSAAEVQAMTPDRSFSFRRELDLEHEHLVTPVGAEVLSTCGMRKVGRRDLVCLLQDPTEAQRAIAKYLVEGIATELALGKTLEPGERGFYEGRWYQTEQFDRGVNAPDLELDDDALLISFE